ncbi:hypothetical protein ABZT27_35455 [Streptomyces sp. NPDC005389]|uniref:hypothetical protein n=1 Tax=Streptomyces sp. NPDC005389 TaxID=3157040 RepID=UPI0033B42907
MYDTAPYMKRLGDQEETAYLDLRFNYGAPSSLRRGPHAAVIGERVALAAARSDRWSPL